MNEQLLSLDGYLTKENYGNGFTFTRVFDSDVPPIKIGLGAYARFSHSLPKAGWVPNELTEFENVIVNAITEKYVEYSRKYPDNWQDRILLDQGYIVSVDDKYFQNTHPLSNSGLKDFSLISTVGSLLLAGIDKDVTAWAEAVTVVKERNPRLTQETLQEYYNLGMTPEEFAENGDLPVDIVKAIYNA